MNIFALDQDPTLAAAFHCDKHVVKMIVETAQILCTVHKKLDPNSEARYRATHKNHPCVLWAGAALANYRWLVALGLALSDEYTKRYGKVHKSLEVLHWCEENEPELDTGGRTDFCLAMPAKYQTQDAIESYRAYYLGDKKRFATWKKPSCEPWWWS